MTETQSLGDVIASQVRAFRKRRGWSVRELAARCAELGARQLTSSSLFNIERGQAEDVRRRRREVSAEELAVLAQALGVPPVLLLFPVGDVDTVEVLPGRDVETWAALRWFTGEWPLPTWDEQSHRWAITREDRAQWEVGSAPVELYRAYHQLLLDRLSIITYARSLTRGTEGRPMTERATEAWGGVQDLDNQIRSARQTMRKVGITPPKLRDGLAYLDDPDTANVDLDTLIELVTVEHRTEDDTDDQDDRAHPGGRRTR